MARKTKEVYDLNMPFTARGLDKSTNRYSRKASSSLVLWLQMTSGSPTNGADNSLTAVYEDSPAISSEPLFTGYKRRPVAQFSDSDGSNIKVTSNIALSHSKLAHAGTPYPGSDLPFSVSAWVRFDDIETGEPHYVFGKDDGSDWEYFLHHGTDQKFSINLRDSLNGASQKVKSTSAVTPSDFNGKWNHIVVTYDGRGGESAYLGIKMYVNGVEHGLSDNSSQSGYVGMRPNTGTGTGELYVGAAYSGGSELDGSMSEFAMWKGHALTQSETKAIYNITRYGKAEMSGYINNPARILLQDKDNRSGSYPTVLRTGDHDFSGKFNSTFDDTNTIVFTSGDLLYPANLPAASKWISGSVATPNVLQGLIAPSTASAGISDAHVSFTPGENLGPFNDSRLYIDADAQFYATGTASGTLPGFSQKLSSKTSIVIDTTPSVRSEVFWSTGSNTGPSINQGRSYARMNDPSVVVTVNAAWPDANTAELGVYTAAGSSGNEAYQAAAAASGPTGPYNGKFVIGSSHAETAENIANTINAYSTKLQAAHNGALVLIWHITIPGTTLNGEGGYEAVNSSPSLVASANWSNGGSYSVINDIHSGLSYFNNTDKKWEPFGNLTTGSNVDYIADTYDVSKDSYLAIIPSTKPSVFSDDPPNTAGFGAPASTLGFPFASKFEATGSHLISMSDYISDPILVEKVAFEFSGTLSGPGFDTLTISDVRYVTEPAVQTFFIIRESQSPTTGTFITPNLYYDRVPSPNELHSGSNSHVTSKHREIVWFGRAAAFDGSTFSDKDDVESQYPSFFRTADLWQSSGGSTSDYPTGSFRVEAPPRVATTAPFSSNLIVSRVTNDSLGSRGVDYFVGNSVGGSSLKDISNGRSFIRSVSGDNVVGQVDLSIIEYKTYQNYVQEAPFLLLPTDKIFLAAAHQIAPQVDTSVGFKDGEIHTGRRDRLTIAPAPSSITIFGSLLQNNLPKEPETNQPLTSDAIHEDLHSSNPVYDQWDVEAYQTLTGSYVDSVITGSMLALNSSGEFADPDAADVRKVQASVASGQAGDTGSLQRFVRLVESRKIIYDTATPNPGSIFKLNGFTLADGTVYPTIGPGGIQLGRLQDFSTTNDSTWPKAFPFEAKYMSLRRTVDNQFGGSETLLNNGTPPKVVQPTNIGMIDGRSQSGGGTNLAWAIREDLTVDQAVDGFTGGHAPMASAAKRLKIFFGFGDGPENLPTIDTRRSSAVSGIEYATFTIRGLKYGLMNAVLASPSLAFRRDRYGQFRDMLEQRSQYAVVAGQGGVDYPIEINFIPRDTTQGGTSDPDKTHSQNLSTVSSSSLPYFDGLTVDRSDNPDETLDPVEV